LAADERRNGYTGEQMRHRDTEIALEIRPASAPDLPLVLAADDKGAEPSRGEYVRTAIEEGHCWLAQSGGRVLGYMVADESFYGYPFVWLVVVASPFRRRGVATALMRHAESLFPARKLFTSTNESNYPGQRLMESLGFGRSGRVDNLDEGDPEIIYMKRVGQPG
jgi:ribosomal protein S18 acetylase RimI-like enzyme